jgi:hypothetical protein
MDTSFECCLLHLIKMHGRLKPGGLSFFYTLSCQSAMYKGIISKCG